MVKSCRRGFGAVGGESFERVDSWCREACQGLRERQEAEAVRRLCGAILEAARRSHLMHSMIQGFILSDSQKGSAPMRRGLRA